VCGTLGCCKLDLTTVWIESNRIYFIVLYSTISPAIQFNRNTLRCTSTYCNRPFGYGIDYLTEDKVMIHKCKGLMIHPLGASNTRQKKNPTREKRQTKQTQTQTQLQQRTSESERTSAAFPHWYHTVILWEEDVLGLVWFGLVSLHCIPLRCIPCKLPAAVSNSNARTLI